MLQGGRFFSIQNNVSVKIVVIYWLIVMERNATHEKRTLVGQAQSSSMSPCFTNAPFPFSDSKHRPHSVDTRRVGGCEAFCSWPDQRLQWCRGVGGPRHPATHCRSCVAQIREIRSRVDSQQPLTSDGEAMVKVKPERSQWLRLMNGWMKRVRNGLRGNRNCVSDEVPREKRSGGDMHTWKCKIFVSTISCSGWCMRHGQEYWLCSRPVVIFDSWAVCAVVMWLECDLFRFIALFCSYRFMNRDEYIQWLALNSFNC